MFFPFSIHSSLYCWTSFLFVAVRSFLALLETCSRTRRVRLRKHLSILSPALNSCLGNYYTFLDLLEFQGPWEYMYLFNVPSVKILKNTCITPSNYFMIHICYYYEAVHCYLPWLWHISNSIECSRCWFYAKNDDPFFCRI